MALVWQYDQGKDMRWKAGSDATRDGVCFALSVQFIICTATGRNFTAWLQPDAVAAPPGGPGAHASAELPFYAKLAHHLAEQHAISNTVVTRMAEQQRRVTAAGPAGASAKQDYAVELILGATRLTLKPSPDGLAFEALPRNNRGPATAGWAAALGARSGLKYVSLSALSDQAQSGHGIAAMVFGGVYGLFDPNFGIYRSASVTEFEADIADLIEARYRARLGWIIGNSSFATFS